MGEAKTANVHGVPGERARAAGVMRALWPLLASVLLAGFFLGAAAPRVPRGAAGLGLLAVAAFLIWAVRDGLRGLDSFFKGARGEERVALLLAGLPEGYHVFHDVACGRAGGIDHVVVGPSGLFAVETKCWAGRVSLAGGEILVNGGAPSRAPLSQARASARALAEFLSERLERVPTCVPVVCFASETFSDGTAATGDAWVCNASRLCGLIRSYDCRVARDDIERIAKVMEQQTS